MTTPTPAQPAAFVSRDRTLAIALALTPVVTLNLCYVIAVSLDHIPSCIPYFEGCTSTSSTGRVAPEYFLFVPGLLMAALLVGWFWRRCGEFVVVCAHAPRVAEGVRRLGILAALALGMYTVSIGQNDPLLATARRVGASGFFVLNFAAQVHFLVSSRRLGLASSAGWHWLAALCVALPVAAIGAELAKWQGMEKHAVDNVVEWNGILLVCAFYAVVGRVVFPVRSAPASNSPDSTHRPDR